MKTNERERLIDNLRSDLDFTSDEVEIRRRLTDDLERSLDLSFREEIDDLVKNQTDPRELDLMKLYEQHLVITRNVEKLIHSEDSAEDAKLAADIGRAKEAIFGTTIFALTRGKPTEAPVGNLHYQEVVANGPPAQMTGHRSFREVMRSKSK